MKIGHNIYYTEIEIENIIEEFPINKGNETIYNNLLYTG